MTLKAYAIALAILSGSLWCAETFLAQTEPNLGQSSAPFLEAKTLKKLPHVHSVKMSPATKARKRQIIHILNWHLVERDDFIADLSDVSGRQLSDAEADQQWESFFQELDAVQLQQIALLRELVKSHDLKQVFLEGLVSNEVEKFEGLCVKVAKHRRRYDDSALGKLLTQIHRENRLLIGAAGQLWGSGEIEKVLPVDNPKLMEAANPLRDGRVEFDTAAIERREDAIVRNVLASNIPVAVLVLGGGHDLNDNVKRIGGGEVEYVRLQVEAHRNAVGE